MTKIILTTEQAAILEAATEPVRICCPDGSIAGWVSSTMRLAPDGSGFTPEEIAAAERSIDEYKGPWHTTKEVLDSLRERERA
jgi:hypothetical protein